MERLKLFCLQYVGAPQWLMKSSIEIPKLDELSDGLVGNSPTPSRASKFATRKFMATDSIL